MLLKITKEQFNDLLEGGLGDACSVQYQFDTEWHNRVEHSGKPAESKSMALGIALHSLVLDSDIEAAHEILDDDNNGQEVETAADLDFTHMKPASQVLENSVDPGKNKVVRSKVIKTGEIIDFPARSYRPARGTQIEKIYELAIQIIKQHGQPLARAELTKSISILSKIPTTTISPQMTKLIRGCHLIDVSEK